MYGLTFLVFLPLFAISAGIFCYALARLGRKDPRAGGIMTAGFDVLTEHRVGRLSLQSRGKLAVLQYSHRPQRRSP